MYKILIKKIYGTAYITEHVKKHFEPLEHKITLYAEDLCDFKELEKLIRNLDKQVFTFQPLLVKIANRLQTKL